MKSGVKSTLLLGFTAAAAALAFLYAYRKRSRKPCSKVGRVQKLFIYPIKSCKGIEVSKATCTPFGLQSGFLRDRSVILLFFIILACCSAYFSSLPASFPLHPPASLPLPRYPHVSCLHLHWWFPVNDVNYFSGSSLRWRKMALRWQPEKCQVLYW